MEQNLPTQGAPRRQFLKEFFIYDIDFSGVTAGGTASGNINIQADSDFRIEKLTFFADIAAAVQTNSTRVLPLMTVTMTDEGSGRQLMDQAVPITNLYGTGQIPFILPNPKIVQARSTLSFIVSNFSAATTYNLRLSLIGTKLFPINPQ